LSFGFVGFSLAIFANFSISSSPTFLMILLSFSIRDADGDVSSLPVYIDDTGLVHADVAGYADDMAVLVDAIIDGVIDSIAITYQHTLPGGLATTPVANSEVQKGGLIKLSATGTNYSHSIRVPAMTPSLFVSDAIDLADTDVLAFTNALISGLTPVTTLVKPCNKYEMDLLAVLGGVKSFRK